MDTIIKLAQQAGRIAGAYRAGLKGFMGQSGRWFSGFAAFSARLRKTSVENDTIGNYAGWVYAAVTMRAKRVASTPLKLMQMNRAGDIEEIDDHEILALLQRANPVQTSYQFRYTIELFLCLWGSAPLLKDRAGGKRIQNLWPLRPDLLRGVTNSQGEIVSYKYRVGTVEIDIRPEDIVPITEPNPRDLRAGFSPLQAAALEIDADTAAALWNKYLLENGAEPGLVLQTEQSLNDDEFERFEKTWQARQAGPQNAGRTAVLEKGLKVEAVGRNPQEMQLTETRKFNRNAIVTILGVPMAMMTSEDVNLANAEAAERVFAKNTVKPQLELVTGSLSEFLVPEFSMDLWLDYEDPVPEDVKLKTDVLGVAEGRWMTVNEAREAMGLAPIEGGDAIFKPLGVYPQLGPDAQPLDVPTESPGEPAPAKASPAAQGYARIEAKKLPYRSAAHRRIRAKILARSYLFREARDGVVDRVLQKLLAFATERNGVRVLKLRGARLVGTKAEGDEGDTPPKAEHSAAIKADRIEYLRSLPKAQKEFVRQMQAYFRDQEKTVLKNLVKHGLPKGRKANTGHWINKVLFDRGQQDQILLSVTGEMYKKNALVGANAVRKLLGLAAGEAIQSQHVHDFIGARSFKMVKGINETTIQELQHTLRAGIENAEDLGQIRGRITDVYDAAKGFRAETIARTEVGSAQQFGRAQEMRDQKVEKRVWVCIFSNSRQSHMDADTQTVKNDERFKVGDELLDFPGDPDADPGETINCQCSVAPYVT